MHVRTILSVLGALMASLCVGSGLASPNPAAPTVPAVIDLHVDLPYALYHGKHAIDDASSPTHPDRLVRGGAGTLVLPMFVLDAHAMSPAAVRGEYDAVLDTVNRAVRSSAGRGLLSSPGEPETSGHVATLLSFEGADGFADDPDAIIPWIRRGACFVGLVHARSNALAGSSTDPLRKRRTGLTDKGRRLAQVVVEHGGVLDAAHASDAAVDDMVAIARQHAAPVVVTHTGMRSLRATERNASDDVAAKVASTGGVVGIDIHSGHVGRPGSIASVGDVVAHIEHAVRVAGIDHVAIGSDLDGGIQMPTGADGAAFWPVLLEALASRGWNGEQIEALFRGNAARVIRWSRAHGCAAGR